MPREQRSRKTHRVRGTKRTRRTSRNTYKARAKGTYPKKRRRK